ncbi:TonB-dependent receptor [Rubrolithibacter danxiaensis]|uniref:TonB-dependent receptor n=1 Tax=Rubrolithibacter danxiaensis TaxID=3390805 RepID=UPI003BF8F359
MKLVFFLCLTAMLQVKAATTYAQRISLNKSNASLSETLEEIHQQTGYSILYDAKMLRKARVVNLHLSAVPLDEALKQCFKGQPFSYVINRKTIVITPIANTAKEAQAVQVTGSVTDEKGEPLPGVSIRLQGTSTATVTDGEGKYSLNIPDGNGSLVFSYIGFITQNIDVNNRTQINVVLKEQVSALNEVVVVGYGTQKRTSVVGAVDQVSSAAIEGKPAVNATQALQGVSPNLIIQQRNPEPGGATNINIRGISTMNDNSPLVVIDGIVGGDINLLNPTDIESVSVLKDAGSAAIYGSRAANGVILITTKKGRKNTPVTVTYNGLVGIQSPKILYKPVHGYENAILRDEANVNSGLPPIYSAADIRKFHQQGDNEWFLNTILQNSLQQNHNISVSGGSANSTYLISAGLVDQQSNFVGPGYGLKRYNYRLNLTNEYGKLKLTSILSYARSEIKDHSFSTSTLLVDAGRVPTIYKIRDDEGRYLTNDVLTEFNPLGILEQGGYRKYDNDNVFGNLNAEFSVTDFFKLKGVFGGNLVSNHQFGRVMQVNYFPKGTYGADRNTNDENSKNLFLNTQLLAEFSKTFNKVHNADVLVGVSNESYTSQSNGLFKRYTDAELGTPVSETIINPDSYNTNQRTVETSLNSLFGRASYSFKDKYYGEFNFRLDGSSKFSEDNRWGFFPSFSAGYRLSEENFMSNYRQRIGDLKLRGSYGILGNQNVGNYQYQTTYFTYQNAYGFGNNAVGGTGFSFANPDLRWEKAATFNIGLDAGFFKNALTFSFDYFNKLTSDILIPPAVPGVFGTSLPSYNAGKLRNQGWEVNLGYKNNGKNFRHNLSLNIGDNKNKVLYFEGGERLTRSDEMQILLREGLPFNSYVGLKTNGYFQNLDDVTNGPKPSGLNVSPGDIRYVDVNNDGVIDDNDKFVLGNPFPRLTYGFTYNLGFKNFDLNVFLQGVGKRSMFLRGEMVEPFHFNYSQVIYQHQLDYWTPQNPDARYPRLAASGSQSIENNYRRGSDFYIYDASYLRLKNLQIGYTLPAKISKKMGMQKLRAYLSGQNLLTFSAIDFIDPETTEFDSNLGSSGANSGRTYPTPVYYGFGLDVTF